MLLRLGEAGAVALLTSRLAVRELEWALRERAPEALGALALLLDRADLDVVAEASAEAIDRARPLVDHPADARILASALASEIEYFVTLDGTQFLDNPRLARDGAFLIGTPGECLEWLRRRFRRMARG